MSKVTFKIVTTRVVTLDIGAAPAGMFKVLFEAGGGYMLGDTDWSIGDFDTRGVQESESTAVEIVKS